MDILNILYRHCDNAAYADQVDKLITLERLVELLEGSDDDKLRNYREQIKNTRNLINRINEKFNETNTRDRVVNL